MKKERIKQSLLALALAGVLLVPAVPLGASAFDAGIDQGAEFNLSLGNTGTADTGTESTGSTGSQDEIPEGDSAPQGSGTVDVAGIPVPTYEEFLALSDSEKLALFEQLNALDENTLENLTPEQQARVEPIFRWSSEQTAETVDYFGSSGGVLIAYGGATITLMKNGTIRVKNDNVDTEYTIPTYNIVGPYGTYDLKSVSLRQSYDFSGTVQYNLKMEDSSATWVWSGTGTPIDYRGGNLVWPADTFTVDTGAQPFIKASKLNFQIENKNITNLGTGPIIETYDLGYVKITNSTFTTNGDVLRLCSTKGPEWDSEITNVTLSGGSTGTGIKVKNSAKSVNIKDTTITGTGTGVIIENGSVNISGSSSITSSGIGVSITGGTGSNATLTGCSITSSTGIDINITSPQNTGYSCTATLNGCTVKAANMASLKGATNDKAKLVLGSNNKVTSTGADIVLHENNHDYRQQVETSYYNNGNKKWTVDVDNTDPGATPFGGVGVCQYTTPYDAHCIIYKYESTTVDEWNRTYIDRHKHWWKLNYTGTGNTRSYYVECMRDIHGTCKYGSHDSSQNVEITVPATYVYTGSPVSISLKSDQVTAINNLGLDIAFKYYDSSKNELQSAPSEIGKYYVRPVIVTNNNYDEIDEDRCNTDTFEFDIVPSVEARTGLVYNGESQNLVTSGTLPAGTKVYYRLSGETGYSDKIPTGTNAGNYTVQYYMANDSGNIYGTPDSPITLDVTIAKATPKLTIDTLTHVYDGKVFEPSVTADTDEVTKITVTCRDMQGKYVGPRNAGDYTVEATSSETTNYKSATTGGSLKITPKEVGVTWSNLELVYNGSLQGPTATVNQQDLAEGDRTLSLAVTERKDAGTYTAQAHVQNNNNYRISTESWREFTIKPKEVTIDWGEGDFTYTGSAQVPTAAVQAGGLIGSDTTSITVTGQQTNASDTPYTATAVLGNANYTPENPTKEFTIKKFTPTLSNVKASIPANTKDIAKVTVTGSWNAPSALGSLSGKLEPKAGQSLSWGTDGKCVITCVFTPTDTTNIASVEVENVTVQLTDTELPNVTYKLNGEDWSSEQYLNKDAQVTVTVTDAVSGLKSGEYAIWWDGQSSLEWKSIPESGQVTVTVPAEHGRFFQIRVHAEDKAGNGAGGSWDSVSCKFITQPPVIDLDANKTYYVSTKFSVSGMEITSVTRKNSTSGVTDTIGSTVGDNFLLPGNTDTTYTVTAADKAGNVTTVTVTMKPIASIMDPLKGVTVDNVTTDNEKTVQERIFLVTKLMGTPDIPTNEYNSLYNVLSGQLEPLLDRISQVRNLYNNALKYASITPDTVTKDDLDKILVAGGIETIIDDFVRDFSGNLTNDQKTKIAEIKQNLKAAQDLLKQVSDLEAEINALPNSVEPDDVDAVTRVRDLRSARASLSDHAQELIDSMCNAKLDALWAQATAYKIIKGDGKVWMRSEGDYEVVANGPYDWFTQLLIDGETVEPDSYTAVSGSTVVTLPKAYMDDLKDGKHTVVFVYENDGPLGQAEGSFTVQTPASGSPRTGDENNMLPYGIAIVAALAALAVLFVPKKRKKQ